ncbi:MAG: ATP-dependent protease ATPase subunit HslU [Clostridia bacterium]
MSYTPREIVKELDRFIIGQDEAKKSVAIALRNRYLRKQLTSDMQEEIIPKNILMIGSTGVGKTEIARRLAKLVNAPFIKVEATRFTEVGYIGKDVESIIKDLLEVSIRIVKKEQASIVKEAAAGNVNDRLVDLICPLPEEAKSSAKNPLEMLFNMQVNQNQVPSITEEAKKQLQEKREILKEKLKREELEDEVIMVEYDEKKSALMDMMPMNGMEDMMGGMQDALSDLLPKKKKSRKMKISEARKLLQGEEEEKLLDQEEITVEAIYRVEQDGIVFIDEIDKIAGKEAGNGPDVSRSGVQRDILPIIEGSTVNTKHGPVKTDHILFVAAGAFHTNKPTDLIPELQGRFPIKVQLKSLTKSDLKRILIEPENALLKQYAALLAAENIICNFTEDGIEEIAVVAEELNLTTQNIGARRLHNVLEQLLKEVFFTADSYTNSKLQVDANFVRKELQILRQKEELAQYIL